MKALEKNQLGFLPAVLLLLLSLCLITGAGLYVYKSANDSARLLSNRPAGPYKGGPKRIAAAGDIACESSDPNFAGTNKSTCQSGGTAALLKTIKPDAVLLLGDEQYNAGAYDQFMKSFDKDWGKYKSIAYPVPGNHEYGTAGAGGYFEYFAGRAGKPGEAYYSFDIARWHLIALNSNCGEAGGCGEGSAQLDWLKQDLAKDKSDCTLAFWHHPHYTSGRYESDAATKDRTAAFWDELVKNKADIVLNGHDHLYERFDLQDAAAQKNPGGVGQFTAGTGGKTLYTRTAAAANSQKIIDDQFGVLVFDLYDKAYKWQFISADNKVLDSGYRKCNL